MAIDIHAHCFPAAYLDLLDSYGHPAVRHVQGMGAGDSDEELDARFKLMDAAGVAMQILSITPLVPAFADETRSVEAARLVNDVYADLARRFPDRFAAFAVLPLPHVDRALAELARAMDELGMVGACVNSSILGRSLVDPAFEPVFQELDRRGATLFVHPAGESAHSALIAESGLTWQIGAPVEDTIIATQLIAQHVPLRFPNLRIILCHLGGALPLLLHRLDHQLHGESEADTELPSMQARRMWFDTVSHNDPVALRCAVDALGSTQLVLGTDYPYLDGEWFSGAVSYVRELGLGEIVEERVLSGNASQLLGLPAID